MRKKKNPPNPIYILQLLGLLVWLLFLFLPENKIYLISQKNTIHLENFTIRGLSDEKSQSSRANKSITNNGQKKETNEQSQNSFISKNNTTNQSTKESSPENILKDLLVEQTEQQDIFLDDIQRILTHRQTNAYTNSSILQAVYEKTKNKKILAGLVRAYQSEFSYKNAYTTLLLFDEKERIQYLDGQTILNILVNAPIIKYNNPETIAKIEKYIISLHQKGYITDDDKMRYLGLLVLLKRDITKAQSYRRNIKTKHKDIINLLLTEVQEQTKMQDMPSYYLDAKIAMHLVRYGYFRIAQQIALQIVSQNPKYILPFQILAFSHFVMQDWEIAGDYLQNLIEIDNNHTNQVRYNFLLGIALFWQKKYSKAIIAFNQSTIPEFQSDITRYLLMSYEKINDINNMVRTYQRLLGQPDIDEFDFFLYFEQAFYKPFATRSPYKLYEQNKILGSQYVFRCTQVLFKSKQNICQYGKAGLMLIEGKYDEAAKILIGLTKTFPTSYIWQALGDYYASKNDTKNAKLAYIKALSLAADMQTKLYAREKLLQVIGVR